MKAWICMPKGLLAAIAASVALAVAMPVKSETAPPPAASFVKLPDSVVQKFREDPAALLNAYQSFGLALSREVRNLVLSDPSTVAVFASLCATASKTQCAAIGAGLAEAAALAAPSNPQLSTDIQKAVLGSNIPDLITAYVAATSSTQTAATGGGGGGGTGSGAIGGGGGTGSGWAGGGGIGVGWAGGVGTGGGWTGGGGNLGANSGSNPRTASESTPNIVTSFALGGAGSGSTTPSTTVTTLRTSTSPSVP
jgi:hypothetical protein